MGWVLRRRSGELVGVTLESDGARPRLGLSSCWPKMNRLDADGVPLLWARTSDDGWVTHWVRSRAPMPRFLPAFDRAEVERIGRPGAHSEAWWLGWIEAMAPYLRPWVSGRARVDLVMNGGYEELWGPRPAPDGDPWGEEQLNDHPHTLPLRPWPSLEDGRVKALRKQARAKILAPVVLYWHSALYTGIVLDGHARLVAAEAEGQRAPILYVTGVYDKPAPPRTTAPERVAAALEPLVHGDDPRAATLALQVMSAAAMTGVDRPVAKSWAAPLRGGARRWLDEVREALRHSPSEDHDLLERELLAPLPRRARRR